MRRRHCQTNESIDASSYQTSRGSVKPLPRYACFSIFKMAAVRHFGFQEFKILTAGPIRRANMHNQHAKLRADQLNRCKYIAVFRFFQDDTIRHLGFVVCLFGPPTNSIWWSLSLCKILYSLNQCSGFDNMQVLIF